ncbi:MULTISPECIES: argininosuccinate synthase [unclassified Brenneria]|uniref:argininosuccinate synthase n=1 Tax=unclassified Brenneria TaxID=2634434 RepID=UPI0015553D6A|nr:MULTISPECIES: argininosuccinate synthase [unclassified Brenneria]MBJ7223353.1 argininosuccinate synthase [Brenneria sp. L3-3C-1]MEE3644593.1 argininosuccinate synthase [Brenneria sp. L3_3C_1]MEE3652155.1 argininosuccinate synthase [Brenneria sp. HEZEL_4_2_4]NPD02114.1 argininosuccinate synthase [Brenneria sp. hezel4-2-4]
MNIGELKGKTVAFAASGGLDSCTITHWLANQGVNVVCLTADLGQPDEDDFGQIGERMLASGAKEFIAVDLRQKMAEMGLEVIQTGAKYEGNYWNLTGAGRQVIIKGLLPKLKERNITIFSHGATGRGNDQVRFQVIASLLDPTMQFYAAWRDAAFLDAFKGRREMIDYCQQHAIPIKATADKPYSTDANLLGLTHEGGALESLANRMDFVDPGLGCWPINAAAQPEELRLTFLEGRPVKLNGQTLALVDIFETLNAIGGKHGVGIAENLVENRFVGVKSRGVYESPAMTILAYAYQQLLQQILDKRALSFYRNTADYLGTQLYQGYWIDLGSRMARHAIQQVTALVSGEVTFSLYKGNLSYLSTHNVKHSLYSKDGSMENEGSFDHRDSEGLLNILTLNTRISALAGQIKE